METKLLNLAVGRLSDELEKLKAEVIELKSELARVKSNQSVTQVQSTVPNESDKNVLLDAKEVMLILGISFNTLFKLVKQGLIQRIKINERRIRYPKSAITDYIEKLKYS